MAKSTDYNSKNAIEELKKLETAEEIAAFISGDERQTVIKAAVKLTDEAEETPEPKREVPIVINAKMANPERIIKKYDELIETLAQIEAQQRSKSKPYRIYFVHRHRMEVMKMNFIKSMR